MKIFDLISLELQGKDQAQAGYDAIIWKLRAGYAIILYTSLSFIVTLIDKNTFSIRPTSAVLLFAVLIAGFSVIIAILDYYFVKSKLRVVVAKNRLSDLAADLTINKIQMSDAIAEVKSLLHNSGEPNTKVEWQQFCARRPIFLLYTGTCLIGIITIAVLFLSPVSVSENSEKRTVEKATCAHVIQKTLTSTTGK